MVPRASERQVRGYASLKHRDHGSEAAARERSIALTALETRENVCGAMFTITASVYCPLEKTLNPAAPSRKL